MLVTQGIGKQLISARRTDRPRTEGRQMVGGFHQFVSAAGVVYGR